jgi:hypothetical protein
MTFQALRRFKRCATFRALRDVSCDAMYRAM